MSGIAGVFKLPSNSNDETVSTRLLHLLPRLRNRGKENLSVLTSTTGHGFDYYRSLQHIDRFSPVNVDGDNTGFTDFYPRAGIAYISRTAFQREALDDIQPRRSIGLTRRNSHQSLGIFCDGELANGEELREELRAKGAFFFGDTDAEVLLRLIEDICKDDYWKRGLTADYEKTFRRLDCKIDGAISALVLDGESNLVAYRSQSGGHPLEFMRTQDGFLLFASENYAFQDLRGKFEEVRAGHIKWIDGHTGECVDRFVGNPQQAAQLCMYEPLYMLNGGTVHNGRSCQTLRRAIGHAIGKTIVPFVRTIAKRSNSVIVASMPNGGIPYADGVYDALAEDLEDRVERDEVIKVLTTTRVAHGSKDREAAVRAKYGVDAEKVCGRTIITVDENLIEGTTNRVVNGLVREAGATAVHGVICSSPVIGPNYSGMGIKRLEKLAYWHIWRESPPHERAMIYPVDYANEEGWRLIGRKIAELVCADSMHFMPLGHLERAMPGRPRRYDFSAFTLRMPTQVAQRRADENLMRLMSCNAALTP